MQSMVKIYCILIREGVKTIEQVPVQIREEVQLRLESDGER
ncbi:CD1375 family protein [Brevibacillus ruminantium]|uniref:CD1375 family protein n=1 Tax=Brevibacillus ruminantium TaxID=2950604 RepID=A0ABY4WJY6_9BACL|nr:CD1375 family protein [Brevibacillus ruminantium]USG67460.1 CD1375 family protein [Brevibacillus ruminantium]